jgi:PAS domain S-box-containing protein
MNIPIRFLMRSELRNAIFYGIFAILWIFISDELLLVLTKDNQNHIDWRSLKDIVFVIVSSVFVYSFFLRERQTRDRAFDQELEFVHEIGRFVAGSIEYATFSMDAKGLVKTWDSAAARMLGRSSDEVLNHHFSNCFVGQEFWKPKDLLRQASETGRASFTGWLNRFDGSRFWGEVAFEKIKLLKGQFAFGAMIRNLSGARGNERFTSMIESMSEGLIVIDREWRFAFVNANAGVLLNREPAKLIGKALWSEFPLEEFTDLGLNCKKAMTENLSSVDNYVSARTGRLMENRIYPSPDGILIFYTDVTEKNQIQEAIRINEQRLRLVLEAGQQGFFDLDLHTGMTTTDSEMLDASGARQAVMQPFSEWIDQIHPSDRERARDVYQRFISQQSSECRVEFRVQMANGTWRWKLSQGVILERDEVNRPIRMMGTLIDIQIIKDSEHALQTSNQRYFKLMEASPIALFESNADGETLYVNEKWHNIMGFERVLALDYGWTAMLHPSDKPRVMQAWSAAIADQTSFALDYRVVQPNGNIRWVYVLAEPLRDAEYQVTGYLGSIVDLTMQKQAELELEATKKRLQAIVKASPTPIVVLNPEGLVEEWNTAAESLFGWQRKEVLGQLSPLFNHEDPQKLLGRIAQTLEGKRINGVEVRPRRKNGTLVDTLLYTEMLPVTKVNPRASSIGVYIDMTERKRASQALEQNREDLNQAQRVANVGSYSRDIPDGRFELSEQGYRIFGIPLNEPITFDRMLQSIHPEDRPIAVGTRDTFLKDQLPVEFEYRVIHTDQSIRFVQHKMLVNTIDDRTRVIGTLLDITERKLASTELEKKREDLNLAQRVANIGSYSRDLPDGLFELSDEAYRIYGIPFATTVTAERLLESIHSDDREAFEVFRLNVLTTQIASEHDYRVVHVDGTVRFVQHRLTVQTSHKYEKPRAVATILDITDRKKAQQELEDSEKLYRTITENAHDVIVVSNMDGKIRYLSPSAMPVFGYNLENIQHLLGIDFVHPDDVPAVMFARQAATFSRKDYYSTLFRLRHANKNYIWVESDSKLTRDPKTDQVIEIQATMRDVHNRVLAREQLKSSEQLYRTITENARDVILITNMAGELLYATPSMARVFGFEANDLNRLAVTDFIHIDDMNAYNISLKNALRNNEDFFTVLFRAKRKDNNFIWADAIVKLIREPNSNRVTELQATIRDVTSQVTAQEKLEESEHLYRTITENAYDVTIISALDGKIRYFSPSFKMIFGYHENQLDRNFFDFFEPDDIEPYLAVRNHAIKHQETLYTQSFQFRHQDGHYIWVESISKITRDPKNNLVEIQSTLRDISERRQAQAQLEQLNAVLEERVKERTNRLNEVNKELESFTSSVSHDLRSPLNVVQGFGRALLEDFGTSIPVEGLDYVHRMVRAAVRMDTLITDLLQYSRLSKAEIKLTPTALEPLLTEVRSELRNEIAKRDANLLFIGEFPNVQARELILRQALINLVGNSLKFMLEGQKPEIKIWAETSHDQMVRIHVQDNGIGIAAENLEKIFLPFERLHGISEYPGSGIGLAFVKRAIDRMGGKVGVRSTPNQGSHFWLELAGTRELS